MPRFAPALCLLLCAGCLARNPDSQSALEVAFPRLRFTRPVDLQSSPDGRNRLFVVEQAGFIRVFANDSGALSAPIFLDIRDRVEDAANEEGLLGLAFHPDFKNNRFFYVNYTASSPLRTVIARFEATASNPDVADPMSQHIILEVLQPFANHNAGQLAFGPDGLLYIGLGDGGSGGDPQGNGQNRKTLLGSLLRIDVDAPANGRSYGIPPDNPYAGNRVGFREEIFAYGLRNPWRFSFDPQTGWLWAGDVGQNRREEIDLIEKGKNYGWNIMEGTLCYQPPSGCDHTGLTGPIWDYGRSEGQSITGGYVYRGSRLRDLIGAYIYADFGSGKIWALRYTGLGSKTNTLLFDSSLNISSLGIDEQQELYFCAFDGRIYRLVEGVAGLGKLPTAPPTPPAGVALGNR